MGSQNITPSEDVVQTLEKRLSGRARLVATYARERALRSEGAATSEDLLHAVCVVLQGTTAIGGLLESAGLTQAAIEGVIGTIDGPLNEMRATWSASALEVWQKASDIAYSYGREFHPIEPEYVLYELVLQAQEDAESGVARVIQQAAPGLDLVQLLEMLDGMSAGTNRHEPIYTRSAESSAA